MRKAWSLLSWKYFEVLLARWSPLLVFITQERTLLSFWTLYEILLCYIILFHTSYINSKKVINYSVSGIVLEDTEQKIKVEQSLSQRCYFKVPPSTEYLLVLPSFYAIYAILLHCIISSLPIAFCIWSWVKSD